MPIFYLKVHVLKFLGTNNLNKIVGSDISQIVDFFQISTFDHPFSVFSRIKKQRNEH